MKMALLPPFGNLAILAAVPRLVFAVFRSFRPIGFAPPTLVRVCLYRGLFSCFPIYIGSAHIFLQAVLESFPVTKKSFDTFRHEILLMAEPFGAVDEQNRFLLQQELLKIWEGTRKTVVFITHSVDEAVNLGDRVLVMTAHPGRIKAMVDVKIPRPRDLAEIRSTQEYLGVWSPGQVPGLLTIKCPPTGHIIKKRVWGLMTAGPEPVFVRFRMAYRGDRLGINFERTEKRAQVAGRPGGPD